MALDKNISKELSCLETTKILMPHFNIIEEKDSLPERLIGKVLGYALIDGLGAYMFLTEELPRIVKNPKHWNEQRKMDKKLNYEALVAKKKSEDEHLKSCMKEYNRLVSLGLDSADERKLYSIVEFLGLRLNEGVRLAKHLNEKDYDNIDNIRPDLLPVKSEVTRTDSGGRILEVSIDRKNLATLVEGQLYFSTLANDFDNMHDPVGLYNEPCSSKTRYIDHGFIHAGTEFLVDEIYRRSGDAPLGLLGVLSVRKDKGNILLERLETRH